MPRIRPEGGILGNYNNPAITYSSGMWTMRDVDSALREGMWPSDSGNPDPYFYLTSMVIQGDSGSGNNTVYVDSSPNSLTVTPTGRPIQGTFSPYNKAGWSAYFNGSSYLTTAYVNTSFDWWRTDFTLEAWIFPTTFTGWASGNFGTVIGNMSPTTTTNYWCFGINSSGSPVFQYFTGVNRVVTSSSTVNTYEWSHIAVTKNSSGITIWTNGVPDTTTAITGTPQSSNAANLTIGAYNSIRPTGYISNIRIVNGETVYTTSFTLPTSTLEATSNTRLLTLHNNRFENSANLLQTFAPTSNVAIIPFSPYAPSGEYSSSTVGGSYYFPGISGSNLLTLPAATSNYLSDASQYTIEMWVYPTGLINTDRRLGPNKNGAGVLGFLPLIASTNIFSYLTDGGTLNGTLSVPPFAWSHLAISISGGTARIFVNGRHSSNTASSNIPVSASTDTVNVGVGSRVFESSLPFKGFMSDIRLIKGAGIYVDEFTPPTSPLASNDITSFLLSGTNSKIIDLTGKNNLITIGSTTTSSTVQKFGNTIFFSGSSYLLVSNNEFNNGLGFGTKDFTVEGWFYANSVPANSIIFDFRTSGGGATQTRPSLYFTANGILSYYTAGASRITSSTITGNTWYHFAVSRTNGTTRFFIDGNTVNTNYNDTNDYGYSSNCVFGSAGDNLGTSYFTGYMDEIRISKYSRYTTNTFIVPQSSFPIK